MSFRHLDVTARAWEQGGHPLERKKPLSDGVALLEFAPGFEDPSWCRNGHVIHVLEGCLELILRERVETVHAGDGCVLDPDTEHRARNPGQTPVRLFVISRTPN
jgi:quercetin dioxygenase-like cupin family protein